MAGLAARDLALRVSDELQRIAGSLSTDRASLQFCALLKAHLIGILEWLKSLSDDDECVEKINNLLEDLESLCQPLYPEASKDEVSGLSSGGAESYPALVLLLQSTEQAARNLHYLATDPKARSRRRQILNSLKDYRTEASSGDKGTISPSKADLQASDPPECGKEIVSLYETFVRVCLCNQENASDGVMARIRLQGSVNDDDGVTFRVLFLAHPHQDAVNAGTQPWWQDTSIAVLRPVKFGGDQKSSELSEIDEQKPFCSYISSQCESGPFVLHLSATEGKLFFQEAKDREKEWELKSPSISLGRILETISGNDMSGKMKQVLSWLLAKSVWQYYSSPWMLSPWSKEIVHFLFERRTGQSQNTPGIFVNEPLLSVLITPESQPAKATTEEAGKGVFRFVRPKIPIHKIPKILALGVMLIEIQLGKPIESLYREPEWSSFCPEGKETINTNYNICNSLIKDTKFFTYIPDPLEDLIKDCIWPKKTFIPHLQGDNVLQDEERIRDALYVHVNCLETYVSKQKPQNVKPLILPRSPVPITAQSEVSPPLPTSQTPPLSLRPRSQPTQPISTKVLRLGGTMAQATDSKMTARWFARMASLTYILQPTGSEKYESVKIAVLDTGVASNDAAANFVSGYRDFVDNDDNVKRDNTGHGTTSVNLVLEMCESAEVYAVRIFEKDEEDENTMSLTIEAIKWCIKNKMDIVCMACGFLEDNDDLFQVIHEASANMLIFAAPTNESNAGEIAYPARYDEVFCAFSTNGAARSSAHINPSRGLGRYNFAVLGEGIKTYKGEVKSGTSFSTAILAGIAGRLLDFSRHGDTRDKMDKLARMRQKRWMTKVLRNIAEADGPYSCIKPWKLLPEELRGKLPLDALLTDADLVKAREDVCRLIMTSLYS